ncbi:unnamed protein product [Sphenostylis stenocarpa]|uniref:Uncharacterized protein n=1 Tax=Sphenostylis stenocarpa TaxID=92480 RepID=A0AA86TQZ7_9FABA|nr:unnamed protein product [Sphenostylis stenocarpa]
MPVDIDSCELQQLEHIYYNIVFIQSLKPRINRNPLVSALEPCLREIKLTCNSNIFLSNKKSTHFLFEYKKSGDGKVYDSFTISRDYRDVLA